MKHPIAHVTQKNVSTRAKILVADDDNDILEFVAGILSVLSVDLTLVSDAKAALNALGTQKFDLIITDISMPDMDGLEFLGKLRDENNFVPVIILTGHSDVQKFRKAWKYGAIAYVEKPTASTCLVPAVTEALSSDENFTKDKYLSGSAIHRPVTFTVEENTYRSAMTFCEAQSISLHTLMESLLKDFVETQPNDSVVMKHAN